MREQSESCIPQVLLVCVGKECLQVLRAEVTWLLGSMGVAGREERSVVLRARALQLDWVTSALNWLW